MKKVFFDTSAIYAYINLKDPDHRKIKSFIDNFKDKLAITNYVFDEIVTLVLARLGHKTAVIVGDILLNSPQIEGIWVTQTDEKDAWLLFSSRTDKEYSFTDCTSFTVMRRLNIKRCLALDEHFKQEGFEK
ncbi:MAG: PIN domain-containing protein [Thermodesulfovibrionales bacterium]